MRLARKLAIAMLVGIAAVTTVTTYSRVEREHALFVNDMARDDQLLGRVFAQAVAAVWAAEGERHALWVVRVANQTVGPVRVRLASLDPRAPASRRPALGLDGLARAQRGETVVRVSDQEVVTVVPVPVETLDPRALEIREPLREERAYLRASVLANGASAVAMIFVCGGLALALGWAFVGRPMRRLTEQARRVAAGDRTARVALHQNDEIAEFATEMNTMVDRLAEAESRVAAETSSRLAAVEQLRHADRLRTVGQLASGLAHELGTPLNVVGGRARLIQKGKRSAEEAADDARIIAEQADRMAALIRQLLDFARRREPKREEHDLRLLARECRDLLAPLAAQRRVAIQVAEPETPVPVLVDRGQLQQAVANLVVNGIDAMEHGGTLTIRVAEDRTRPPHAEATEPERAVALVAVEDQGVGISPENLEKLFEPFFTTKGVGEGTGLGLPVSHGIVRDHGGWITVHSTLGTGSQFTVVLPR